MTKRKFTSDEIKAVECRHVVFIPPIEYGGDDFHLVKEVIHTKTGERVPNIRLLRNFKRPFWVSKPGFRRYEQKKEWEDVTKLKQFECTQSQLIPKAVAALDKFGFKGSLKNLSQSPYLYGSDILSTSIIKQEKYRAVWPELNTPSTVAPSDTETDMLHGHQRIIMQTLSFKDRVYTAVVRSFLNSLGGDDAHKIKLCKEALVKYLGQDEPVLKKNGEPELDEHGKPKFTNLLKDRNINWEIELVDHDGIVVLNVLKKAHEWQPDFMAFWNMNFDVKKMNESLKFHNISLPDAWSDPSVAGPFRFFEYKEGSAVKRTASGKETPVPFQARWHTVFTPASFYVIDAMCTYKQVRTGKPEERSYGLDAILNKHLKRGKLKISAGEGLARSDWHVFMQRQYPVEYIIYNVFDCVGMELLDEKTKDLSVSLPSGAAMSDYSKFNSQPRRVVDKLHYFVQARGKVVGTTSDTMEQEFDKYTVDLKNWIVMLPAHMVDNNGLKIITEYPTLPTNLRLHVGDLDVAASYPYGEAVFNISKETTKKELVSIDGVSDSVRRLQGINLSGGASNAVEICTGLFKMPQLTQLLEAYQRQDNLAKVIEDMQERIDDSSGAADTLAVLVANSQDNEEKEEA